jgi:hypothetical protein
LPSYLSLLFSVSNSSHLRLSFVCRSGVGRYPSVRVTAAGPLQAHT